jgi:hypothetical protein
VQAADIQLGKILANNQVFVVPHFQRPYVWDQEDNWEPLWADVRAAAEGVENEQVQGTETDEAQTYFLGAIVTQERRRVPPRLSSANVIDGQQRLTTLQVLVAAARAAAVSLGHEAIAGRFEEMLENSPKAVHEKFPEDRRKLVPLPQDREAFAWAVQLSAAPVPPVSDHQLIAGRLWFEETITAWAADSDDAGARLDALQFALDERVQLVHIALDSRDDPQVIFEALNHRGVRLNAADLIKNLLFQTLERQGDHELADDLLVRWWLPFDGKPWRDDVTSGRITRSRVDVFIAHWLTMRCGAEVSVEHLFGSFKKWLRTSGVRASDVIIELRRYGDVYLRLLESSPITATGRLVDSMRATSTNTPWPVLLFLHGTDQIPAEQRSRAALALDSFLMRRAICGMTSKDYNNLMRSVLSAAQAAEPANIGEAVQRKLSEETAPSRLWPSDSQFRQGLLEAALYSRVVRGRLRALLVGLENHLTTGKTESVAPHRAAESGLTIEHLLPQGWRAHWPLAEPGLDAEIARDDALHRLGNLTLLTAKLNPSVSNKAWPSKRTEIQKHSLLRLTTSSVLTAPPNADPRQTDAVWVSDWDESRITTRGRWLADVAVVAWPRPAGGPEVTWDDTLGVLPSESAPRGPSDISIADLVAVDMLSVGDELVWSRPRAGEEHRCAILVDGQLRHSDGRASATPSGACALVTGGGSHDGWECWRVPSRGNALIDDLRQELREARAEAVSSLD